MQDLALVNMIASNPLRSDDVMDIIGCDNSDLYRDGGDVVDYLINDTGTSGNSLTNLSIVT